MHTPISVTLIKQWLCTVAGQYQLLIMRLSKQEKIRYARIIFDTEGKETREIDNMTLQELEKIRSVYAQKIAYESVNGEIEAFGEDINYQTQRRPEIPNLLTSLLCCVYPEQNQQYFNITTSTFLKRLFSPFIFWNNQFLEINDGLFEYYGSLWLILTYTIVLGLSSNLNRFFIESANFQLDYEMFLRSLGAAIVFFISEPMIYASVLSCLGSFIMSNHSIMISSYSIVLYLLPTLFCLIPSLYWHMLMIIGACVVRLIFLFRNYSIKLETKTYILFVVILIIQGVYAMIILKYFFNKDAGYDFQSGFQAVFTITPTIQQTASSNEKKAEHEFILRQFEN